MSALPEMREQNRLIGEHRQLIEFSHGLTPMFVGDRRRLLVSFHQADPAARSGRAVLLCNPFGQEALRAHRLYRVLAERLCRAGIDVMRFDYYGTGDSYGEDDEGELIGWKDDILAAHQELLRCSGVNNVAWVGIRLGATLAFQAAHGIGGELRQLVLIDPILDGAAYSRELRLQHVARLESVFRKPDRQWRETLNSDPAAFPTEVYGFALAAEFHDQLAQIRAERLRLENVAARVTVLMDAADPSLSAWRSSMGNPPHVEWTNLTHGYDWTAHEALDGILVPAKLLRDLVKCFGA